MKTCIQWRNQSSYTTHEAPQISLSHDKNHAGTSLLFTMCKVNAGLNTMVSTLKIRFMTESQSLWSPDEVKNIHE